MLISVRLALAAPRNRENPPICLSWWIGFSRRKRDYWYRIFLWLSLENERKVLALRKEPSLKLRWKAEANGKESRSAIFKREEMSRVEQGTDRVLTSISFLPLESLVGYETRGFQSRWSSLTRGKLCSSSAAINGLNYRPENRPTELPDIYPIYPSEWSMKSYPKYENFCLRLIEKAEVSAAPDVPFRCEHAGYYTHRTKGKNNEQWLQSADTLDL